MSTYRTGRVRRAIAATTSRLSDRAMRARLAYPPAETALIVVDAQRDLLARDAPGSDLVVGEPDRAAHLAALDRLINELRARGVLVVFTRHAPLAAITDRPLTASQRAMVQRDLFSEGTAGAELADPFTARQHELISTPHVGLSAFTNTDLDEQLEARGIVRVIVAGAITETTVDATARSAVERGMQVTVAADACIGSSRDAHRTHVELVLPPIVQAVLDVDDLLSFADTS